jgi:hypothetical protein
VLIAQVVSTPLKLAETSMSNVPEEPVLTLALVAEMRCRRLPQEALVSVELAPTLWYSIWTVSPIQRRV